MIFTVISSLILTFFYLFMLQEMGSTYIDTYIVMFIGIAIVGWILGWAPRIKYGFLTVSLIVIFAFSFWSAKNPSFPYSWSKFGKDQSIVDYHKRYHVERPRSSSPSSDSYSGSSSSDYSSGSSYGGRSYSGGGFSGGK